MTGLAVIGSAWCAAALGATPGVGPEAARFNLVGWQVEEGLPQASVTALDQGPDGYLLAATFGGVAQFDGARFTVWDPSTVAGLPSARITAVAAAPDGSVWVGTQFGRIARIVDGAAVPAPGDVPASLGVIWDLEWREDGLWAGTEAGLLHLDRDTWTAWAGVGPVTSMAVTDGAVWGAGRDGVIRVAGGTAREVALPLETSALALAAEPGTDRVWAMTSDGLVAFDADVGRLVAPALTLAPQSHPTQASLLVDGKGRLWLGTTDALVLAGDAAALAGGAAPAITRWETGSFVRDLLADRDGTIWAGTGDQGLLRVTRNPFERYGLEAGLAFASASVVEASGPEVLVAAECSRVMVLRGGRFEAANLGEGGCVHALFRDTDGVWVGEDDRVIPPAASGIAPFDVPGRVLAIARDPAGELWIGTEGVGAWVLRSGAPVRVRGVPDGPVTTFAAAPDGAWWMGLESGVAVALGDDVTLLDAGIPGAQVRSILFDPDGTAWLGTYGGGLVRVRGGESRALTTAHGMPENIASVVLDDGRGHLWTNGNRGAYRISRVEANAVADGRAPRLRAVRFATGEGNGGSSPAGGVGPDGRVWLPTLDGVVAFDPLEVAHVGLPPVPRIEELLVEALDLLHGGATLPPGDRDLSVRFTSAALRDPFLARFEYRLLPSDPDWRDAGESRVVRYPDLAPGHYVFEVRAANEDGVWSVEPARAAFSLQPGLTETALFKALALLSLVGAIGTVAYLYARRLELHSRELEAEIGQRRQVEAELRVREAHYRRVFEGASDGLLVTGPDGRVLDANPAAAKMFGRTEIALRLLDLPELLDAEHGEGIAAGRDRFPAQIATVPLDGDRRLTSVVDLGPVAALRARLEQAERLEAIGRLAGGVAHDFNNVLMVIRANASELLDRAQLDGSLHESVGLIANAADRGAELTQQLLLFGRRQILRPVALDAKALVGRIRPMLRRLLRDNVVLLVDARCAWVHADPAQLELALVHLVLNAADGLPDGGRLSMNVEPLTAAEADSRWPVPEGRPAAPPRGWVHISVTDDGAGLSADALPRIFEPFFSAGPERESRIGLAGVHGFAAQSLGELRASSSPGAGSCFDLLLPAAEALVPAVAAPVAARPPARERVLVCDDDPFVRRSVERLVESGGYVVLGAGSGREALELLDREGAEILVTDVLMPEMNGAELARRARTARPDLPVLFMSGYTRDVLPTDLEGELLNKPFTREGLLDAVRRALASRPRPDVGSTH